MGSILFFLCLHQDRQQVYLVAERSYRDGYDCTGKMIVERQQFGRGYRRSCLDQRVEDGALSAKCFTCRL